MKKVHDTPSAGLVEQSAVAPPLPAAAAPVAEPAAPVEVVEEEPESTVSLYLAIVVFSLGLFLVFSGRGCCVVLLVLFLSLIHI